MSHWLVCDGHLGWPLFAGLAFSMLVFLLADFVWRVVKMRFAPILVTVVAVWAIGIAVIVII